MSPFGLFGPPNVEKLKAKGHVQGLIKALSYEKDWKVRKAAAEALGQIGDNRATEPLVAALKDRDADVRRRAARALEQIGDARAVEPLVATLKDPLYFVREKAAEALESLGWQPGDDTQRTLRAIARREWKELVGLGAVAVEPLVAALKDYNRDIQQAAAEALGEIKDARAVEPLAAALKDDNDWNVKKAAAQALGQIGDSQAVELLVVALERWSGSLALEQTLQGAAIQECSEMCESTAKALIRIGPAAVEPLVAALIDKRGHMRQAAARALEQIDPNWMKSGVAKRAIPRLRAALKDDKDQDVQKAAAQALGQIGDARALVPLVAALQEAAEELGRKEAAQKLGRMGVSRALSVVDRENRKGKRPITASFLIEPYVPKREECTPEEQALIQVVQALIRTGPAAVEPLVVLLKDKNSNIRRAAAKVLDSLGWQPVDATQRVLLAIAVRNCKMVANLGPVAVAPLLAALRDEDRFVRSSAAEALGEIGDVRAVEPLVAALKDKESLVRASAAKALGEIGDVRAVEPLVAAALSPDIFRGEEAEALRRIGGAQAMESLALALKNKDARVRKRAVRQLWRIGGVSAVEPLVAALNDQDQDVRKAARDTLMEAVQTLAQIDPAAVEPLVAMLRGKHPAVREAASQALCRIGPAAVGPLVAVLNDQDQHMRRASAGVLVKIGTPAVEPLVAALKDRDFHVRRCAAARALGQIGAPHTVEPLLAALRDDNPDMRQAAAEALGNIGDMRGVEPLLAALKDENSQVRRAAALATGELGDMRAVEPLVVALKDETVDVRKVAARVLGKLGDTRAVKPLVAALSDRNSGVQQAAAKALINMGHEVLPPKWPPYSVALFGHNIVSVSNPNEFNVRVGLRSGNEGMDFTVPANGAGSVSMPNGSFDMYFQYSSDPLALYQGDSIRLHNTVVQISIERVIGGTYGIRKV